MYTKQIVLGFSVKVITGLDDTITHIPILASLAGTRAGKIAFSIGTLAAIILAIVAAIFFSSIIKNFSYYRYIAAGLIFALALAIYFDIFVHNPRSSAEKKLLKIKKISVGKFTQLMGLGFIASFATVMDDIIAYSPLFFGNALGKVYVIAGILAATILEIILVIYFSEKISRIKYKEEIASAGLVLLGILILAGAV